MAAADLEPLITAVQPHQATAVCLLLQSDDTPSRNQGVTMDAKKSLAQTLFQRFQRLFQQCLAAAVTNRDIFLLRLKKDHVIDFDTPDPAPITHHDGVGRSLLQRFQHL